MKRAAPRSFFYLELILSDSGAFARVLDGRRLIRNGSARLRGWKMVVTLNAMRTDEMPWLEEEANGKGQR